MRITFVCCFFLFITFNKVYGWDIEELEVFDVVDDVQENFYNLLNVSKDASNQEIRSSYRSLSLKLHPDKNLETDTSEQFRHLVAVYEVLKSSTKRKIYDDVLVNGLPNWRSAVYYYRYVRKMGVAEAVIILFVLLTLSQYLVKWGMYFEKKYDFSQKRKTRKTEKLVLVLPKPSITDTLPVQIPRLIWNTIITLPTTIKFLTQQVVESVSKPPPEEPVVIVPRVKTIRKRNKFVLPEGPNFEMTATIDGNQSTKPPPPVIQVGGLWTDDDLAELIRLIKKYPQGSLKRWENIAEALMRTVPEVTYMANKMKENSYRLPSDQDDPPPVIKIKQKTKKDTEVSGEDVKKWSQTQQKALEDSLSKYKKGCAERWDRIASCVPNKTKEECMLRVKYLAESVRKQKENIAETNDHVNQINENSTDDV